LATRARRCAAANRLGVAVKKGIEIVKLRVVHRGTQRAIFDVVIGDYLVLHGLELHRHETGHHFIRWPRTVSWRTAKIASRFRTSTLTALGHFHPRLFETGLAAAPLLDALDNEGGAMSND
jgi:hypothetical protein